MPRVRGSRRCAGGRDAGGCDADRCIGRRSGHRRCRGRLRVDAGRLVEVDRQTDRLAAIREAAVARGYGLVINARIAVFLADGCAQPQHAFLQEAVARACSYREAGVDCVFPIFLSDAEVIASSVEAVQMPANILALPQAPPIARLADVGVARVSYGSMFHQRSMREFGAFLDDLPR